MQACARVRQAKAGCKAGAGMQAARQAVRQAQACARATWQPAGVRTAQPWGAAWGSIPPRSASRGAGTVPKTSSQTAAIPAGRGPLQALRAGPPQAVHALPRLSRSPIPSRAALACLEPHPCTGLARVRRPHYSVITRAPVSPPTPNPCVLSPWSRSTLAHHPWPRRRRPFRWVAACACARRSAAPSGGTPGLMPCSLRRTQRHKEAEEERKRVRGGSGRARGVCAVRCMHACTPAPSPRLQKADEETAKLYEDFVESFQAPEPRRPAMGGPPIRAFVRGGTVMPGQRPDEGAHAHACCMLVVVPQQQGRQRAPPP